MRGWIVSIIVIGGILGGSGVNAQQYPTRPIKLVVAFAPGGTTDFAARLIADKAGAILGQSIVVENKPGGNGGVAAEFVAKAEPDGYVLFFTTLGAMAINPNLRTSMSYDPVADFEPVTMLVRNTILLAVNAQSKVKTVADYIVAGKSPQGVSVGVTGIGAATYICAELLQKTSGIKQQIIPYRGASQSLTDVLGGRIDAMFGEIPVLIGSINAGTVRALASTSATRSNLFPEMPTLVESGFPDVVADNWAGVIAPAHTPKAIVDQLNAAFATTLSNADVVAQLALSGVTPSYADPEQFRRFIRDETARWGKIIRENDIQTQ
ncbi:MAG: Bug family tripartite tricarboxylate transporter substrate binding protein [Xanthobacteraceae bacterium]